MLNCCDSSCICIFLAVTSSHTPRLKTEGVLPSNEHMLLAAKSNDNWKTQQHTREFLKTHPEDKCWYVFCILFVQSHHIRHVCRDAFHAGWLESHQPFGRSWSGTNGHEGVRLIRLVYCTVMISCYRATLSCGPRPNTVLWNMCYLVLRAPFSRKQPEALITTVAHLI